MLIWELGLERHQSLLAAKRLVSSELIQNASGRSDTKPRPLGCKPVLTLSILLKTGYVHIPL